MTKWGPKVSQKLQKLVPRPPREPPNPDVLGKVKPYENLIIRVRIACGALIGSTLPKHNTRISGYAVLLAIWPLQNEGYCGPRTPQGFPKGFQNPPNIVESRTLITIATPRASCSPSGNPGASKMEPRALKSKHLETKRDLKTAAKRKTK